MEVGSLLAAGPGLWEAPSLLAMGPSLWEAPNLLAPPDLPELPNPLPEHGLPTDAGLPAQSFAPPPVRGLPPGQFPAPPRSLRG